MVLRDKIVIIFRLQPRGSITFVYKIDKYGVFLTYFFMIIICNSSNILNYVMNYFSI